MCAYVCRAAFPVLCWIVSCGLRALVGVPEVVSVFSSTAFLAMLDSYRVTDRGVCGPN